MRPVAMFLIGLLVPMVATPAVAGIPWYSNQPRPPVNEGVFSDGFSSGGQNFYSFALGQRISVATDRALGSFRLWGASEYVGEIPDRQRLSTNIVAIQLTFFDFGVTGPSATPRYSFEIPISRFSQVATGTSVPGINSPVFALTAGLDSIATIAAGNYVISAGALLANEQGSSFAWILGAANGTLPGSQAYGTTGDQKTQWGQWVPLVDNYTGAIELYSEIPGPATVAVLALGGLAHGRRRR